MESKSQSKVMRVKPPATIEEWRSLFMRFCMIYCAKYPKSSVELFDYVQRIYGLFYKHKCTLFWRHYDEEFRKYKAWDKKTPWNDLHHKTILAVEELNLQSIYKADTTVYKAEIKPQAQAQSTKQKVKLPLNGTCHHWNSKFCKAGKSCKWKHECCWCNKKDHKAYACPSKK